MRALTAPLTELGSFQQILEGIAKGNTPVFATGVIDAAKNHLAYSLQAETKRPLFLLTYSELRAKEILEDLTFFTKDCAYYPAKDILFYSADVHSMEMNRQRFLVLERLLKGETPIIVASAEALLDKYPPKEIFASFRLTLRTGEIVEIAELTRKLVRMGYERTELVESPGQFSLRGGILDIWSLTAEDAVRIEFWDDEIDSIRSMDAQSQRSVEKLEEASIFPMREMVYTEEQAVSAAERIEQEYRKVLKNLEQKGEAENAERLREHIGEDAERLRAEKTLPALGAYADYFYENPVSLLSYLREDTLLVFDEPERIREHMDILTEEYHESVKGRIAQGYLLPGQSNMLYDYTEILRQAEGFASASGYSSALCGASACRAESEDGGFPPENHGESFGALYAFLPAARGSFLRGAGISEKEPFPHADSCRQRYKGTAYGKGIAGNGAGSRLYRFSGKGGAEGCRLGGTRHAFQGLSV